ncbi:protein FAM35A isoform X2 [Heterocephalus glaber]|uniref:Protein FAM35A isoform X2 n=1 Tax=Heterocephalus glaber TaxID=10181 RepID=A0AAX6S1T9_HETGA|nr:protein FAM35A isoform X2 [Heterocephalus glaber]
MSRRSQVHIFWGAPVGPLKMTVSQGTASLMSTANHWGKIQLLYHQHALHVKEESCKPKNLKDCQVPEAVGAPGLVSSVQSKSGFPHSVYETQDGKLQKNPSGPSAMPTSSVQIRGCKGTAQHLFKEEKHQKLPCENKITSEQPENQLNTCGQNFQTDAFHLGPKCVTMLNLVSSIGHRSIGSEAVETKCVGTEHQEIQSQHQEFSSNAVEEAGPVGEVRKGPSPNISADTEFLSIMTCSQVAFLAQRKEQGQKSTNTGTVNMQSEPKADPGEVRMPEDNLIQPHEDFAEQYENGQNQAHSLELFSSVHPETESSHIHVNTGQELEGNAGSQELFSCEDELPPSEIHIELCGAGILCSQLKAVSQTPVRSSQTSKDNLGHSKALSEVPPASKKMKLCSNARDSARARYQRDVSEFKGIKKLSLIKNCDSKSHRYNCLVMVLTPCHVKEVNIKSGPNSGSKVPLATITVVDQSEMKKVVLWRTAAFWALTVFLGDIILLTDVTVHEDQWVGETVLQSTFTSQLLNLGSYSSVQPEEYSCIVSTVVLQDLLAYVSSEHSYLKGLPQRWPQRVSRIKFVELEQLEPDTLVHAMLRVVDVTVLTEALYSYRGQKQRKVMLTVEQAQGQHYVLVLWGPGAAWYPQLQRKKGYIWEFKYLFVQRNCILESLELHTTPWSSSECLFDDDVRAIAFKSKFQESTPSFVKMSDLATHLKDKYSGVVLIKARIVELVFPVRAAQEFSLNAHSSLERILSLLPNIIYTGCAGCGSELDTDENKIYRQCLSCLPLSGKKIYYRPALMTIVDGSHSVCIRVGSKLVEKILLHISPDYLHKVIVPSLEVTYAMVAADLLHSLLAASSEPQVLKIESLFVLDENSYPLQQDFSLLDFCPAGSCPEALSQRGGAD